MITTSLTLAAPAKLNLFLHITGRRSNGYHELQTLFQLLDYADTLTFERRDDGVIQLEDNLGIPVKENLIWRAASKLKTEFPTSYGANIRLHKRLPMGGGLGGGSSNAATTLIGLNQLWGLDVSIAALALLGVQLGADVPVFIHGNTAWGEGIGEKLTPVELPEAWYLVITPPCAVSTAEIYAHPQLPRNTPPISFAEFLSAGGRNDTEQVVCQMFPQIVEAMNWLTPFAQAKLTGTGSSIFARFDSQAQANSVAKQIPTSYHYFIAKGLNRAP